MQQSFKEKQQHNLEQQNYLKKIGEEIARMKEGSVALVNQITTISKIRIYDPRNTRSFTLMNGCFYYQNFENKMSNVSAAFLSSCFNA